VKIWKVILATLVIFAAGFLTGGIVMKDRKPPAAPVIRADASPPSPVIIQERFLERMKHDLNLTEEQTNRLDKIFYESRERTKILMDLINPELQAELREVREKIRAELTPEQQQKFEELLKHPHRPPGPGGDDRGRRRPPGASRTNQGARSGMPGPPP